MGIKAHHITGILSATILLAYSAPALGEVRCAVNGAVDISNVTSVAETVWEARWSQRADSTRAGMKAARDAVPGRVQSMNIAFAPEISLEDTAASEYSSAATIAIALGDLADARRDVITAEGRAFEANLAAARWLFVEEVQDQFLVWQRHELERQHLHEYLVESNAELDPIRQAQQRSLVSKLDVADLEAEVAWIRAELAESTRRVALARSRFMALLGADCELAPVAVEHSNLQTTNPWTALASEANAFPEVQAFEARSHALRQRAVAHQAANPLTLEVGVGVRTVGFDGTYLGPVLALTFPFQSTEATEAVLANAQAASEANAGEWAAIRIRSELTAEADNFKALLEEYSKLQTGYVGALSSRAKLMDEAFKASQVEIDRVIRARRDLHEAEHKLILLRAEIDARRLKATAIEELLTRSRTNRDSK